MISLIKAPGIETQVHGQKTHCESSLYSLRVEVLNLFGKIGEKKTSMLLQSLIRIIEN